MAQVTDGVTTTFALDVVGLPEVIYTSEGNAYLHLPGVIVAESSTGETHYLLSDGLGSIRQAVDEDGSVVAYNEFDPYGNPIQSGDDAYGFTGEWWQDEIGLLHLRARWYVAKTGTFLSVDPIESEHPYLYVRGNPVNLIDPSGYQGGPGVGTLDKIGACFVAAFAIPDPGPTEAVCGVIAIGLGVYVVASPIIAEAINNGTINIPRIEFTFSQSNQPKIPLPPNACSLDKEEIRIGGILPFPIGSIVGPLPGFGEGTPLSNPFIYRPGPTLGGEFTGPLHLPGPLTGIQPPLQIPGFSLDPIDIPVILPANNRFFEEVFYNGRPVSRQYRQPAMDLDVIEDLTFEYPEINPWEWKKIEQIFEYDGERHDLHWFEARGIVERGKREDP